MILVVTGNQKKFEEIKEILNSFGINCQRIDVPKIEIQSNDLKEIVMHALIYAYPFVKREILVEDSGLFINALGGFPGPYSSYVFKTIGNKGILKLMEGEKNRRAKFVSVVGYFDGKTLKIFEGEVWGEIAYEERGEGGFGFDPIFIPEGFNQTFAEMPNAKNKISHRYKALEKFARWYNEYKS